MHRHGTVDEVRNTVSSDARQDPTQRPWEPSVVEDAKDVGAVAGWV